MKDPRISRLAKTLVNYSAKVKKGEAVLISAEAGAKPLVLETYREVLKAGAHPRVEINFDELREIFLSTATPNHLKHFPKISMYEAKNIDAAIYIIAPTNTRNLSSASPIKMTERAKVTRPISEQIMNKVRWVVVNYPTPALAQEADMSLEEYEDFVFKATNIDWKKVDRDQTRLKKRLDRGREVRIVGKDTDLTMSVKGRKWIKGNGEFNMPDGEMFTAPVENSVNGRIWFEFPAIHRGREVTGVRLEFEKGRVIKASADKNEKYLKQILDTDPGARRVGELGIGTNYGIRKFTKDILFDEKIGGTVHIAVGRSYPECGGKNKSAIHWDIIKDLRSKGSALYLDGKPILKNGKISG